jgi:hypothetical protein
LSEGTVPVDPAALMEAVMHHALAKQEQDDYQDGHEENTSNAKSDCLSVCMGLRIRMSRHQS